MFEEVRQRVAGVPPVEATDEPEGRRRMKRETQKTNKTVQVSLETGEAPSKRGS